jgi:cell fate (sporulation/competence/biofilm development) regulator YmcA (YheA/YmcA/DUF963 family)
VDDVQVSEAATRLAALLAGEEIFQNFSRLARRVRMDADVTALVQEINARAYQYDPSAANAAAESAALEERLEALPLIREYRAAESSARALFRAVDAEISGVVGVAFAENARACWHG